jgi:hypothetical protein
MMRALVSVSCLALGVALAVSGCEAVPYLVFEEGGAASDASNAAAEGSLGGCQAFEGGAGTVPCEGICASCGLCAALGCRPGEVCCATLNNARCATATSNCH